MKATELQINDWVFVAEYDEYTPAPHNKPYPVQILHGADIDRADEISFEPIPLTPEILEKNGWLQNGMTQEAIIECDGENCDDTWCEMTYDGDLNCYFDYEENAVLFSCDRGCDFLKIHFVHELQHALRLCGLEELADNFKI